MQSKNGSRARKSRRALIDKKVARPARPAAGQDARSRKMAIPAAYVSRSKTRAPRVTSEGNATIVRHQEYLLDVPGTVAFSLPVNQVILIQPGLNASFPWLAQIAANYEMYRVRRMQFRYRNRVPTTTAGSVYMSYQNDSEDNIFASKAEMMAYEGSSECSVYDTMNFDVKIVDYMKKYFIRTQPLASGADAQLYDAGMFSITIETNAAIALAGELLVYYEVEFYKPKISTGLGVGFYTQGHASGVTNASFLDHPLSSAGIIVSDVVPNPTYMPLTGSGATDFITFSTPGVYLFTIDVNINSGTLVGSPTLNLSPGANVATSNFRSTVGPLTASNLYTAFFFITVFNTGQGTANSINFSFTGTTGVTSWVSDWVVVAMNPQTLGPTIGMSHPLAKRRVVPVPIPPEPVKRAERKERRPRSREPRSDSE